MRKTWFFILSLSTVASPVWALEASDTMALWSGASAEDKSRLISGLLEQDGRENGTASVMKCLDTASGISGHAQLAIRDLVKVCEKENGQPV